MGKGKNIEHMAGVVIFTLVEWLNYYLVYRNVFGVKFIKNKIPYIIVILLISVLQAICFLKTGNAWRDINIILLGLVAFPALEECTGIIVFVIYGKVASKKLPEDMKFSW